MGVGLATTAALSCAVAHVLGVYLLRASGVLSVLFGADGLVTVSRDTNPLVHAPDEWVENHEFWDYIGEANTEDFWGESIAL